MKNIFVITGFVICLVFCGSYTAVKKTSGSHPGSTGAPLEQTCAQSGCHTDANVILNAVNNNTFVFGNPDSTYVPNATYNVTVQVKSNNTSVKFGFECLAIKDNDSLNVGQFTITDISPPRTQTLSHTVGSDMRYSVTHKMAGTPALSTNFDQWTFSWTAPSTNVGKITFYYATLVSNNDGMETGDRIYLHSFTIRPASPASIKEIAEEKEFNAFYSVAERELVIDYKLKSKKNVIVSLYDNFGRQILNVPYSNKSKGTQSEKISIPNEIESGVYFVHLEIDNSSVSKKIIIQ